MSLNYSCFILFLFFDKDLNWMDWKGIFWNHGWHLSSDIYLSWRCHPYYIYMSCSCTTCVVMISVQLNAYICNMNKVILSSEFLWRTRVQSRTRAPFMSIIPAGCRSDETLNWRSLVLSVYAEASKRSHPWGKCVTWVDSSSFSPHQSTINSGKNLP